MVDVAKELQKLKAMVNQKQTTAIFSNKSNESTKLANGDTELYINDMTRKFSFTRAGVMNPVMIDPKNKSLENVEYLNGVKVEDITSSAIAIAALERDVNDHEVRISKVESEVAVVDELDERLTDCEIKDVEQDVKIAEVESEVNDRYTKKEVDDKFENFIIKDHTHTKFDNDLTINGDVMFGQQSSDVEVFNFLKHEYLYMDPDWGTLNNKIALTIAVKNDLFEITTAHIIYIGVEALIDGKVCSWKARYDLSQHSTMPSLVIMPCTSHTIEPNEIRFVPEIPGLPNYTFVVQDIDAPYNQYPITVTELRVCKDAGYPVKIWKEGNVDIGRNLTVNNDIDMTKAQDNSKGPNIFMGSVELRTANNLLNTYVNGSIKQSIDSDGVRIRNGNLKIVDGNITFQNNTVGKDFGRIKLMGTTSEDGSLEIATADDGNEPIYVRQYTHTGSGGSNSFGTINRTLTLLDKDGNTTFPGNLYIPGAIKLRHKTGREIWLYHGWNGDNGGSISLYDTQTQLYKTLFTFNSQTITHVTNITGVIELGTFCEATGNIYDGYESITNTDCICQVKTATSLNKKIVGIICSEKEFASHGDVLVRVNDINGLEIGDILCPDERGYGRKATETDLMYMMLHAIPRPKITSLTPAEGFEGYVACFLV